MRRGKFSDLGPVERGYFIGLHMEREHSQSAYTLDYTLSFVARSVTLSVPRRVR